jgi:hypothetical protein
MNAVDRVWGRIKTMAEHLSDKGEHLSDERAEEIVQAIIQEERVDPAPPAAVKFLARELIARVRSKVSSTVRTTTYL